MLRPNTKPNNCSASKPIVEVFNASLDIFIRLNKKGSINGKLSTAISAKLLSERDDIAATIVSVEAKPDAPNINPAKNNAVPIIIFPKKS
ncbi:MAG TPA: hypothetical protein ENK75_01150 [Saprospiraceae bacterium]|nr:hypothetical protein [Saprospiraceae bacterium]